MGEEECTLEEIEDDGSKKFSLWSQFENHVKAISDDSTHLLEIGTKVNLKTPSTHFAKVKRELEKEEKAKEKPSLNNVSFLQSLNKDTDGEISTKPKISENVQKIAKRGWGKIKRNVEDVKADRKAASSDKNWGVLKHCLENMTQSEDVVRQKLYERYLNDPYKWRENLSYYPPHVLQQVEQERRARERNERSISAAVRGRRPMSRISTATESRSTPVPTQRARPKSTPIMNSRTPFIKSAWK
ncbi:DgyrCDS3114 [Dimorphilus gyrociliatus]|uniref:DgyrCDS3114 n=1 Tax=Dimorphilus gyrociliatus TaxID=2664684 RepID=A0A7I8VHA5_9ANNE|nr:DgyrCDS3114 [Dimorphilus gyrociliatus]